MGWVIRVHGHRGNRGRNSWRHELGIHGVRAISARNGAAKSSLAIVDAMRASALVVSPRGVAAGPKAIRQRIELDSARKSMLAAAHRERGGPFRGIQGSQGAFQ